MTTEVKERKIPLVGMYSAIIDGVRYEKDVQPPPGKNWNVTDKLTLIFQLTDTKDQNDGEKNFAVFVFQNVSKNIHFQRDGSKSLTRFGQLLKDLLGEVPYPLKSSDVDFEALEGCYASVFVKHKSPNAKGEIYPEIAALSPPGSAEQIEFNEQRKQLIFKGK